jgi:oligogalacturonide lyase
MVMNRPDGISLVDMESFAEKNLYTGNLAAFQTGASKRVVYARPRSADKDNKTQATNDVFTIDIDTGAVTKIAAVEKGFITSVNADDTLLVGSYA